ncbi:3'-5' exonuclease [Thioflexithrix psekupsensis]|uniref:Exonuclease domain-containing protein n=1 Tax=Thioflexithrix psekupsensis TaxID=1570016 RepID=A0A251X963_9GAMM|nr:3'-5' exonuclease [Thioflexithrix psekupsensis]OUD14599.1 hypothetical protein TPSD3_09965 [Thioflexithrix psekupsensis]
MPLSQRQKLSARRTAIQQAREILAQQPIFLDTETTGIDQHAEVIEIAVLDREGTPLLDTLIRPQSPIPWQAESVHGIANEMVRDAPTFAEVWPSLNALLQQHPVVIYNRAFDLRLIAQTARRYQIVAMQPLVVHCAMVMYAAFYGQWDEDYEAFIWQRLGEAAAQIGLKFPDTLTPHRAYADADMCRQVVLYLAKKYHRRVKR